MRKLTPKHIQGKRSTPWMVRIPKPFVLADPESGKKPDARKFFASRGEALDYIHRLFTLGVAQADWRQNSVANGKLSLAHCVEDFLTVRYRPDETNNNLTRKQERHILKNFVGRYRNMQLDSFTHREVDAWLRGIDKAPQTVANHFAIVRRFFNWCEKEELLTGRNPILRTEKPKVPYTFPTTISPEAMEKFLGAVKVLIIEQPNEPWVQILAYLCIGGFAGLRTSEIKRLRWEDINWVSGRVNVLKSKRGHPRSVTILPVLRHHLQPYALTSGPVFQTFSRKEAELRAVLSERAGVKLPHNCLRHSFASYHIAMWENYEATAFQMGHTSPRMTRAKYVVLKGKALAEQWWELS